MKRTVMKYFLPTLLLLLASFQVMARKPNQEEPRSNLQDRIRSEFGLDLPCHYQLMGEGVRTELVDINEQIDLEACKDLAKKALRASPAGYRRARVKSFESMEWIILER